MLSFVTEVNSVYDTLFLINSRTQIIWLACIYNFEGFKYSKNKWNIANSLVICLKFKLETLNFFMYSTHVFSHLFTLTFRENSVKNSAIDHLFAYLYQHVRVAFSNGSKTVILKITDHFHNRNCKKINLKI
jgi:hypothetical protein